MKLTTKIVDSVTENTAYEYADSPLMRLVGPDSPADRRTIRGRRRAAAKEKGTDTQLIGLKGMETDTVAMIKKNSTKYMWTNPETGETARLDIGSSGGGTGMPFYQQAA